MSRDERPLEEGLTGESGPAGDGLPGEDATSAIGAGPLELLGLLPNSSNYTFLARTSPGGEPVLAVYKPHRGESPLWDFAEGSLGRREVAAFVVARALGWPNVPPTLLRDGPEGPGSVQLFVPFEPREHYFTLQDRFAEEFRAIAAFDLVVNNADRKGGHCLLGEDGLVWAIDHGVCFHEEPKLRTVIWEYVDEPIPPGLVDDIAALGGRLDAGSPPSQDLESLLAKAEIQALARRIDAIVARPVYPAPEGDRPYPWPPV
ncbi:MAG: SCO1664 family protein [Actinomycetota bacterium]